MPIKLVPAGLVVTFALALFPPPSSPPPAQSATITLDPNVRLQTFHAWEGAILASVRDYNGISLAQWDQIFDLTVNDLGYTRMRLSIQSGVEGSGSRYTVVNDDGDPNSTNPSGFTWSNFDVELDIAAAFRQRVLASGQTPYISLNYVDFGGVQTPHVANPEEYGEFMLAVFQHTLERNGFVPDGIEAILEPDTTRYWSPAAVGNAIVAAAARLRAAGFTPEFIGPSTASMGSAAGYIDGLLAVPGTAALIAEFSYHRYGGGDPELDEIVHRAVEHGKRVSMLEYWGDFSSSNSGSGYKQLGRDIQRGRVSAWQQGVFADNFGCVSQIVRLVNGVPELCPNTKLTRQWTKYIRPGAQRIGVNSSLPFEMVAFINRDGKYVVVVKAEDNSGSFSVAGLPAGTYELSRTDAGGEQASTQLPDVTIQAGGVVSGDLPGWGVFTIVSKEGGASPPPPPSGPPPPGGSEDNQPPSVSLAAPPSPLAGIVTLPVSCADNVGCTSVQLRVDGVEVGPEQTNSPFALQWNTLTVGDGPHQLTVVARDAAGNTAVTSPLLVSVLNTQPGEPSPPPSADACAANPIAVTVFTWPTQVSGIRTRPDYRVTTNGTFTVTFSPDPQQVTVTNSFGCSVVVTR